MSDIIAFLALAYLGYRLFRLATEGVLSHSSGTMFSLLADIPDSNVWKFCFNIDDTMAQRSAIRRAAKDLRVQVRFARPRGDHSFMAGVFVSRDSDQKRASRLSDRRYEILSGRLEYHICQTCGYEGGDWHYEGCEVGKARGDKHFIQRDT
jgi:hypothetical protein